MYLYVSYSFYIADDVALSMKRSINFQHVKKYCVRPFIPNKSAFEAR